ncbi:MAG: zinc-ribbon and FHA domain-containing protein [Actinomycetota bacterium]|nr:zinc-ribbon and FHA domain-containing protein [Actinomycetota bacterium]
MFCTQCGHQNPEGSRFCAQCGTAIAAPPNRGPHGAPDSTSTISLSVLQSALDQGEGGQAPAVEQVLQERPPAGTALLVVKRGPNAGSRFLLDADVTTAGRHPESDIFLDDVTVSRRHAEFVRQGGQFLVRDVGSLNGTYLDRERIDSAVLAGGDEVQIGKYRLVFLAGSRSSERA